MPSRVTGRTWRRLIIAAAAYAACWWFVADVKSEPSVNGLKVIDEFLVGARFGGEPAAAWLYCHLVSVTFVSFVFLAHALVVVLLDGKRIEEESSLSRYLLERIERINGWATASMFAILSLGPLENMVNEGSADVTGITLLVATVVVCILSSRLVFVNRRQWRLERAVPSARSGMRFAASIVFVVPIVLWIIGILMAFLGNLFQSSSSVWSLIGSNPFYFMLFVPLTSVIALVGWKIADKQQKES